MPENENNPAWERLDDESGRAYLAFCKYRDLLSARTLDKAYCFAHGFPMGSRRVAGYWQTWYQRHEWKRRAKAYDAYLEREARREAEEEYRKALQVHQKRVKALSASTLQAATNLLQKSHARLKALELMEIEPQMLPAYFRAAATIAEAAINTEAQVLGVEEILRQIMADEQ